jgi:type II secretory pathway component PulK
MKLVARSNPRGFALIMVLVVITVLGVIAGGFATAMRIETKLASNSSFENDMEWIGRSGVEFARYVLAEHMNVRNEPWDSLNQKWAGGPMGTNEVLELISLENNKLGPGVFSVRIIDQERKFNINGITDANAYIIEKALSMAGADPAEIPGIRDAFLDWFDRDDNIHFMGAESDDYISRPNPGMTAHFAKNGMIDELGELLFIRGVTPEMCRISMPGAPSSGPVPMSGGSSLCDLFTVLSSGGININTASSQVLQLLPGLDANLAEGIVLMRAGWDGVDGTEDDVPYRSAGELINVPGMVPQFVQQLSGVLKTRSLIYEVFVEVKINNYVRRYSALVRRDPTRPGELETMTFHWD